MANLSSTHHGGFNINTGFNNTAENMNNTTKDISKKQIANKFNKQVNLTKAYNDPKDIQKINAMINTANSHKH